MICDKCGYAMAAFDAVCPRCHGKGVAQPQATQPTVLTPQQQPAPLTAAPPVVVAAQPVAAAKPNACLWGCFALLFVFVVLPVSCSLMFGSGKTDNRGAAYVTARMAIERQLKAPATAVFPHSFDRGVSIVKTGNTYFISSYVDAQNSFGAMIRSRWTAEVEESEDGKDVTLKSADLIE